MNIHKLLLHLGQVSVSTRYTSRMRRTQASTNTAELVVLRSIGSGRQIPNDRSSALMPSLCAGFDPAI